MVVDETVLLQTALLGDCLGLGYCRHNVINISQVLPSLVS